MSADFAGKCVYTCDWDRLYLHEQAVQLSRRSFVEHNRCQATKLSIFLGGEDYCSSLPVIRSCTLGMLMSVFSSFVSPAGSPQVRAPHSAVQGDEVKFPSTALKGGR